MSLRCVASVFLGRGEVHQAVQRVWCFPDGTVFRERCALWFPIHLATLSPPTMFLRISAEPRRSQLGGSAWPAAPRYSQGSSGSICERESPSENGPRQPVLSHTD